MGSVSSLEKKCIKKGHSGRMFTTAEGRLLCLNCYKSIDGFCTSCMKNTERYAKIHISSQSGICCNCYCRTGTNQICFDNAQDGLIFPVHLS